MEVGAIQCCWIDAKSPSLSSKPERAVGVGKTVHCNCLLPIGYPLRLPVENDEPELRQRPGTRPRHRPDQSPTWTACSAEASPFSESDYKDVDPSRPLAEGCRDLLSQFFLRPQSQTRDMTHFTLSDRHLEGALEEIWKTIDIPDASSLPPLVQIQT